MSTREVYRTEFDRCLEIVSEFEEGTEEMAVWLVRKYKNKTVGTINGHPHVLVFAGIPFEAVEKAKYDGAQYDEIRIEALIFEAYRQACGGGTQTMLKDLLMRAWKIEKNAGRVESRTSALFLGAIIRRKYKYDEGLVCSKHFFRQEGSIAKSLKAIIKQEGIHVSAETISVIERKIGIKYDETQREAFSLLDHGCGVLTGGPGTGKTTLLRGMVSAIQMAGREVVCMAPTGKASQRMKNAIGMPARTIHKTLGILPYEKGGYRINEVLPERAFVIIDEVSMVDTDLAVAIMGAVEDSRCSALFVGDADQLQSVGPGNFLLDIMAWDRMPLCRLEHIHRQSDGTVIPENARRVKDGNWNMVIDRKSYFQQGYVFQDEMVRDALALFKKHFRADSPGQCKIFTPVRDPSMEISTVHINNSIHCMLHDGEPELQIGQQLFSVGDEIMITRNSYELGLFNGDEGIVTKIVKEPRKMIVCISGQQYELSGDDLQYVDLSYALTVHKGQGSSSENAIILVPEKPRCLMTRRLFYVALTRAEKRAYCLYEQLALQETISNVNEGKRYTGLQRRLGKCSRIL